MSPALDYSLSPVALPTSADLAPGTFLSLDMYDLLSSEKSYKLDLSSYFGSESGSSKPDSKSTSPKSDKHSSGYGSARLNSNTLSPSTSIFTTNPNSPCYPNLESSFSIERFIGSPSQSTPPSRKRCFNIESLLDYENPKAQPTPKRRRLENAFSISELISSPTQHAVQDLNLSKMFECKRFEELCLQEYFAMVTQRIDQPKSNEHYGPTEKFSTYSYDEKLFAIVFMSNPHEPTNYPGDSTQTPDE